MQKFNSTLLTKSYNHSLFYFGCLVIKNFLFSLIIMNFLLRGISLYSKRVILLALTFDAHNSYNNINNMRDRLWFLQTVLGRATQLRYADERGGQGVLQGRNAR